MLGTTGLASKGPAAAVASTALWLLKGLKRLNFYLVIYTQAQAMILLNALTAHQLNPAKSTQKFTCYLTNCIA